MAATQPAQSTNIGTNVEMKLEGSKLTLIIDISKEQGMSASGKNMIVATTSGNVAIPGTDIKMGLNLYKKV